jgi:hypothetical protein
MRLVKPTGGFFASRLSDSLCNESGGIGATEAWLLGVTVAIEARVRGYF